MKIKKIASICKKRKSIVLTHANGVQWCGCNASIYALNGMPILDEKTVLRVFDVPDADTEKYTVQNESFSERICFDDNVTDEITETAISPIGISFLGEDYLALMSEIGTFLVSQALMTPVNSLPSLSLTLRKFGGDDKYYVAVKSGLFLVAVVMPFKADESMADHISAIANGVRAGA